MAKLESLIHIQKHAVDEKQKILARLYREQETLDTDKKTIQDQIETESRVAEKMDNDVLLQLSFSNFLMSAKAKIDQADLDLEKLETRITLAQDDIRTAFETLKKTEIVHRTRKDKERKERAKKEAIELDEIGIEGYRRKKN